MLRAQTHHLAVESEVKVEAHVERALEHVVLADGDLQFRKRRQVHRRVAARVPKARAGRRTGSARALHQVTEAAVRIALDLPRATQEL